MTLRTLVTSLLAVWVVCRLVANVALAEDLVAPTVLATDQRSTSDTAGKTVRCTLRHDANGWWLVSPAGEPFFSLGVCMFNQGSDRERYDPAKPSYVASRHYNSPEAWADASLRRAKSWGFTTVGGWSDDVALRRSSEHNLWITPVLHLGSRSGVPWFDMWDENNVRRINQLAEQSIGPYRGDSRVIGYYSDNEIGWWNAILWKMTLEQPASSGQRQRLIGMLREVYADDWDALLEDFEPDSAASWDQLQRGGMLWVRPGSGGVRTVRRFLGLAADRYYQLMREAIRKFDPDALYLGDRYQSFYYPELVSASRRHVDVVSTNLNASWNDGTFIRAYLDTLHELSGRPVVIGEFYMAADENRSGNKNSVGEFPAVATQEERARGLSNTLHALVRSPYVVGADWFQYYDEPPHGRELDGEDYNFGLVDIHDQPYEEVTAVFASLDLRELKADGRRRPDAADGVPPAPADPFAEFQFMTALKNWDRDRGFVPPATEHALGDLYVCWKPHAVYVATYIQDIVELEYYRDVEVPEVDRAAWTLQINGHEPVTARLGAGKSAVLSDPTLRAQSLSGTYHDVRCIAVIEIPAERLGKHRLQPGDAISLESSYRTHGGAARIEWKGEFVLSE